MKLHFLGGAKTVTGSMYLLETSGYKILMECGMFQGSRAEAYQRNQNFSFDPATVDALFLSHAHLDHCGNIPNLVKQGFSGPIFATEPTVDLAKLILKDSAYLQEMDVKWVNKIRVKSGNPLVKPLYTTEDVLACYHQFTPVHYDETFEPLEGLRVTFSDAGHILGSAGILFEIKENGRHLRLGFTGDLGRPETALLRDPNPLRDLNVLITETTYGNRHHQTQDVIAEELCEVINQAAHDGVKVLIPSFALGRTQQIVYYLHHLYDQDRIPDIPIFVDSPLARHTTGVYRDFMEYFDRKTHRLFLQDNKDPFTFERLTYVDSAEESKALNNLVIPHIIISASGMCEGGRILHHLRNNIENPNCWVVFVGYAAQNTLARKIMDGHETVKIFGEEFKVRAKIKIMHSFSAHGDRSDILNYVNYSPPSHLKKIFLVHGEPESAESLVDAFRSKGYEQVTVPDLGEVFEL